MSFMVDFRCPKCNQLLQGNEQVAVLEEAPPEKLCCPNTKDCGCETQLTHEDDDYLGRTYFYDVS